LRKRRGQKNNKSLPKTDEGKRKKKKNVPKEIRGERIARFPISYAFIKEKKWRKGEGWKERRLRRGQNNPDL